MKPHLYLSLLPEALVASHLDPATFGAYLATGSRKRARGQAIFFRLSDDYSAAKLAELDVSPDLERGDTANPRHSAYLSIYRVLETTPLEALEALYLVTNDGRVLELSPADYFRVEGPRFHLYQEFAPITPRVVSTLGPRQFGKQITDPAQRVSVPTLVYAELDLQRLADDPEAENIDDLPYYNLEHLRDCLRELRTKVGKPTKTVIRYLQQDVLFRTLYRGFYVAKAGEGFRFFPFPDRETLETQHYPWWRSALSTWGA
ncbi:hypothetical protein [Actomonas aquatica]|uniref:Uncharacterized protein n=1 Tax=Actomonas aquatica TaxID=2866162 RepID=A0ABZ1CD46_9BACT|nr:hypothetical protein [Opitutus sp. WL0086]WRQ89183.1 hypothetical protein K1X11_007170 [Opitutus sp. WL0086]